MVTGLLLPIGQQHLEAAEAAGMTSVVFGTNAWEFMRAFVQEVGVGTPVLFYESWGPKLPQASWGATFGEYIETSTGFPPRSWSHLREPVAAEEDVADRHHGPGFFAGFYRVDGLHRLPQPKPFRELRARVSARPLKANFVPHGPLLIDW
jgi:hypothetical protein